MGTTFGRLYNYGFDSESPRWDWIAVDNTLFKEDAPIGIMEGVLRMVEEQFNLPLQNVWRVLVNNDGTVELNDFTLPSSTGKMRDVFKQENLPLWIQDSLSVLMIVDQGVTVEGVGKKITDSIFYLMETPDLEGIYGNKT